MSAPLIALDDFAGTGWGVACRRLGIDERGVEIMPEARATRAANGMTTVGADVWEHLAATAETPLAYDLLISSPPCQTFSMAGGGAGRRALDEVVGLIDDRAYTDVERLRAFGEAHDLRTALVLTPLVRVYRDAPTFVVLEQVPPVLPVWERMAVELRRWGYSVATGVLNAEQYGVPQTRRRAVLIARADGVEAKMPTPTHSRYYSRDPKRLDPGVLPWVSMAEALGWGMTARPFVTAGNAVGRAEGIGGSGGKADRTPRGLLGASDRAAWRGAEDGYTYRGDESSHAVTMLRRDEARSTALVRVEESETLPVGVEITVPLRRIEPRRMRFAGAGSTAQQTSGQTPREGELPAHTVTCAQSAAWVDEGGRYTARHGRRGGGAAELPARLRLADGAERQAAHEDEGVSANRQRCPAPARRGNPHDPADEG